MRIISEKFSIKKSNLKNDMHYSRGRLPDGEGPFLYTVGDNIEVFLASNPEGDIVLLAQYEYDDYDNKVNSYVRIDYSKSFGNGSDNALIAERSAEKLANNLSFATTREDFKAICKRQGLRGTKYNPKGFRFNEWWLYMNKRIRINGVLYEAVAGNPDWKELHLRTEDGTKVTVSYADYADVYGSYGNLHGKAPFYYVEVVTAKKRGETEWSTSVDSRNLKKLLNELEDIIEDYDYQFDGYRNHLRDYIIDNVTTRLAGTEYTPRYVITDDGVKRVD